MAVEKRTIHKAVYSVISLLKAHHISVGDVTHSLLQEFAATAGFDLGEVYRKVVLLWDKWKHHEVLLEDALRAVKADPSLLEGLRDRVVDKQTLLVAGMTRFLGAEGQPFALDQRILARVVGLSGQQAASDLVALLLKVPLLEVVERACYTAKRSTVYRWVGPGAVEPQPAIEVVPTKLTRKKPPNPPPQVAAVPPPAKSVKARSTRPGHSWTESKSHPYKSLAYRGGYVEPAHHFAEVALARKLGADSLPDGFWENDKHGGEYGRQVNAARALTEEFSTRAVADALSSSDAKKVYSLAAPWFRPMVAAAQKVDDQRERVLAEQRAKAAENPRPAPVPFQPPRPGFVPKNRPLLSKLKGN